MPMSLWKSYLILAMSLILTLNLVAQGCYNADFELGNFTGWQGRRGDCCPIALTNNGISNGRQTIMTPGIDPNTCGGLSMVYSGSFSARLGNDNVGAEAEGLSFTFIVTSQSTLVQYAYAVVFEDPGHTDDEQPRFNSRVRLSDGSIIACTDYMVTAASNLSGFQSCPGIDNQGDPVNIAWRDWSTVSVDLSAYVGQTVTLEFETGDCSLGGHFGYAYIDAISCSSNQINVQYCLNQSEAVLSAPYGFATYLWETGETTPSITVDPTLYDTLSCYITTTTGCELTLSAALEPTIPTPSFTYTGECEGNFNFTNTSTISNNGLGTYLWNFGDGTTSTLTNTSHIYISPGNYVVTLQIITDNGCTDQTSQNINVYPIPTASFLANDNCFGNPTSFINTTPPEFGYNLEYTWLFGNNISSQIQSPIYTYPNSGTYNVDLIVGIQGTSCRDTVSDVVNIRQNPVSSFLAQNNCQGIQTQFLNNSQTPSWSISNQYLWSFGEFGSTSLIQNPTYTYSSEGTYNVTLLVLSTDGSLSCSSSITNPVTIYPNPIVNFTNSGNECVNSDIIFTNLSTISPTSQIINYVWNFGDNIVSNVPNPTHTYTSANTFNVTLTATSNFGCVGTDQGPIVINPLPVVSFTPNSGSGCPPLTLDFDDSSSGIINSWNWSFGDGEFSSLQNPTHTYNSSGVYQVTLQVTNINGCSSNSSPAVILVRPTPTAVFSVFPTEIDEYDPLVTFTNYSTGATSYIWNFGDGSYSSLSDPEHSYSYSGSFLITLLAENQYGCVDSSYGVVNVTPIFTFYIPNAFTPTDDKKNEVFYGKGTNYKSVTMQIFNRWGEKIFDKTSSEPPIWDGTLNGVDCQIDVYVYQFFVTDIFDVVHVYRGRITLVR
jgi:gliding motility-associated-like protein